jgi:hypothetical protein
MKYEMYDTTHKNCCEFFMIRKSIMSLTGGII